MKRKATTLQPTVDYDRLWEGLFRGKYVVEQPQSKKFRKIFSRIPRTDEAVDEALI